MEILFLIISILITIIIVYGIGRCVYSHKELIKAYKENEELLIINLFFGLILVIVFFTTLCAFNNTFWNLEYIIK